MVITVRIKSASLKHDTQLIGPMSPYIIVYDKDGVQLKRTGLKSGRNPVWDNESIRVSKRLGVLQFVVFDYETLKKDDFVGKGVLRFDDLQGPPNAAVPHELTLTYQDSTAGVLKLEVINEQQLPTTIFRGGNQFKGYSSLSPPPVSTTSQSFVQQPQYSPQTQPQQRAVVYSPVPHHHNSGISLTTHSLTPVHHHSLPPQQQQPMGQLVNSQQPLRMASNTVQPVVNFNYFNQRPS